jgi:hypothetical protein
VNSPTVSIASHTPFRGLPPTVDGFDHDRPAVYPNQLEPQAALDGLEAALDNFERLFGDLNALPA